MSFVLDPGNEDRPPGVKYETVVNGEVVSYEPLFKMVRYPWTLGDTEEGEVDPRALEICEHSTVVMGPDDDEGGFWSVPMWKYWEVYPDQLKFAEGHNREELIQEEKEAGTVILYQAAGSGLIFIGY